MNFRNLLQLIVTVLAYLDEDEEAPITSPLPTVRRFRSTMLRLK